MDAITAMTTRRSVRKYTADEVRPEDLEAILNCGRLAPTGANRQGWRFIVCTEEKVKQDVANATDFGKFMKNAAVVVAVAVRADTFCPNEDSAAATCNMLNAAHALGYGGCWVGANGNPTAKRAAKVLGLPIGWRIMSLFSIGVPAESPTVEKKPLSEVVSYNGFKK